MGEARRRGTFEERKAQAIKAGRIKKPNINWKKSPHCLPGFNFADEAIGALMGMCGIPRLTK